MAPSALSVKHTSEREDKVFQLVLPQKNVQEVIGYLEIHVETIKVKNFMQFWDFYLLKLLTRVQKSNTVCIETNFVFCFFTLI